MSIVLAEQVVRKKQEQLTRFSRPATSIRQQIWLRYSKKLNRSSIPNCKIWLIEDTAPIIQEEEEEADGLETLEDEGLSLDLDQGQDRVLLSVQDVNDHVPETEDGSAPLAEIDQEVL